MTKLVDYIVATESPLPPIQAAMYEYITAANGVFVRGRREGLEAMLPVLCGRNGTIRGLETVEPYVNLAYPRVPAFMMYQMLMRSLTAMSFTTVPLEILFHLAWKDSRWQVVVPRQTRTPVSVQPDQDAPSYENALIEVHSHHSMEARFSGTDNAEETGFRVYAVLGSIFTHPTIRVRVGIYGHRWEIPAPTFLLVQPA
jgi:PRTRC genetic system protein A